MNESTKDGFAEGTIGSKIMLAANGLLQDSIKYKHMIQKHSGPVSKEDDKELIEMVSAVKESITFVLSDIACQYDIISDGSKGEQYNFNVNKMINYFNSLFNCIFVAGLCMDKDCQQEYLKCLLDCDFLHLSLKGNILEQCINELCRLYNNRKW